MKRIIALLIITVLCFAMLTSCDALDTVKGWFGGEQSEPSVDLDRAATSLNNICKDLNTQPTKNFDVVGQVIVDGVKLPVTWTSDNSNVVVEPSTKNGFYTVKLPDVNSTEAQFVLTATISDGNGNSVEKKYTFTLPVYDNTAVVGDLEEGQAYSLGIYQASEQKNYYIIGQMSGYYMDTTDNVNDSVNVYVEVVDGGYQMYCIYWGQKLYVNMVISDTGYVNPSFDAEAKCVYTYDSDLKTLVCDINNGLYAFGVRTDAKDDGSYYTTLGPVLVANAGENYIVTFAESTIPDQADHGLRTPEAIVNAAYELADGESLPGTHTLTGIIKSVDEAYSSQYKNVTVTIVVEGFENKPIKCYRMKGTGADQIGVGDEITVTGIIKNYKGTIEFDAGCTFTNWVDNEDNSGGNGETPSNPETPAGSAVLDLTGNANLVSGSGAQNVFAANGITFTNDKASSTSDLTVQTSYAQRAYKGSTIKIEYPGMTKIVITFDDYSNNGTTYMSGFDGMVVEGATFSRDNDVLTIYFAAATNVFQSTALASQVRIEKIEVYTGEVETPPAGDDNQGGETPTYTAPVAGQAYDLFMVLPSGTVYFNGALDASKGTYLDTTTNASASVKIYFEVVDGGYHIYFMNGETKTYINAYAYLKDNGYAGCHFELVATPVCVWTYNTELGILEVYGEIEGKSDTFFPGTYGSYSTVSLSGAYYKDQIASGTQYPARIVVAGGEVTPPAGGENGGNDNEGGTDTPVVPEDGVYTIPQVLASAANTQVIVKGTVSEIYYAWSDEHNNISFYIVDDAGNRVLIFRTGTKAGIGDQVTVTGTTTLYNNVIQIAEGSTTVIDVAHVCSEFTQATCLAKAVCVVCKLETGDVADHSYVSGTCSVCGHTEGTAEAQTTTASKTMAELITSEGWTSSTTKQSFKLDDVVSVKINGGSNTGKAYNGDHIRIYATDTPAGTITITLADGYELVSVKVSAQTGTYAFLCVGDSTADISNTTTAVSGSSVVLNSVKNGSEGKQVRVTAIEVVYKAAN